MMARACARPVHARLQELFTARRWVSAYVRDSPDRREPERLAETLTLVDAIPRRTANAGDRGTDRIPCSGIAATMRRRFDVGCGRGISCRGWPHVAPDTGVGWAGSGGSPLGSSCPRRCSGGAAPGSL
jgi:hypothetical protein